ncbi:unnamed protein product [Mortierella alpina]
MLLVDGLEVLNSEAKPTTDMAPCERQFLKNLRNNHAIHVVAAEKGVQLPRMNPLDIRGISAMVCGLHADGDDLLVGAACEDVINLPRGKDELATFLSGQSKLLLDYQDGIKQQLRKKRAIVIIEPKSPRRQEEEKQEEEEQISGQSRTPPKGPKVYGLGQITMLAPKASKKRVLTDLRPVPYALPTSRSPTSYSGCLGLFLFFSFLSVFVSA